MLYLETNISFNKACSSEFLPVARKNLHFLISEIFSITLINVAAGILFVGPEPPIPKSIFVSFLLIWNLSTDWEIDLSSIWISGSSLTSKFNLSILFQSI